MMTGYFDLIPEPIAGPIIYVDRIYSTETVDGLAARYCRDRAQAFLGYVPRKFTVKNPLIYSKIHNYWRVAIFFRTAGIERVSRPSRPCMPSFAWAG